MSVTSVRKLSEIAEKISAGQDARQVLLNEIGKENIDNYDPGYDLVLIATYVRSNITKGGIQIGGDKSLLENRFQGTVGLVLKMGPYVDTEKYPGPFTTKLKVGDWIIYKPSDADEFFFVDKKSPLDGVSCRLIQQGLIKGRIQNPEAVF